jgi:hypothetical protein
MLYVEKAESAIPEQIVIVPESKIKPRDAAMNSIFTEENIEVNVLNSESTERAGEAASSVCSFLHFNKTGDDEIMATCSAYKDRTVLGGRRLQEICKTEKHLACPYYLDPRIKS